jgi:hypothetical protein
MLFLFSCYSVLVNVLSREQKTQKSAGKNPAEGVEFRPRLSKDPNHKKNPQGIAPRGFHRFYCSTECHVKTILISYSLQLCIIRAGDNVILVLNQSIHVRTHITSPPPKISLIIQVLKSSVKSVANFFLNLFQASFSALDPSVSTSHEDSIHTFHVPYT